MQKPWVVSMVAASKLATALARRPRRQQAQDVVVTVRDDAGEGGREAFGAAHEALTHALAKLPRRHAGEGDDEEAVERHAVGDIPGGEGGDRVRLAGAGARLEQRHPTRERPAHVEGRRHAVVVTHRSTTSS
jgi:hypothetical protein